MFVIRLDHFTICWMRAFHIEKESVFMSLEKVQSYTLEKQKHDSVLMQLEALMMKRKMMKKMMKQLIRVEQKGK